MAKRSANGITLDQENWAQLVKLGGNLGVAAPSAS
jgi:LDH2 family malate/lactate/ureidoglycolate dehydrogenase